MIINFSSLGGGGGSYVLPKATENTLGGVKIGSGITIDSDGHISADSSYVLPIASENTLGGVKIGERINIDSAGTISIDEQSGGIEIVEELPISAETGTIVGLKKAIGVDCATWNSLERTNPYVLTINQIWNSEEEIRRWEFFTTHPKLIATADGKLQLKQDFVGALGTDILIATLESGQTGTTSVWTHTGQTGDQNILTWNWTNSNLVTLTWSDGGMVSESAINPKLIRYNYDLYEYVDGGKAGQWSTNIESISENVSTSFIYSDLKLFDNQSLCGYGYRSSERRYNFYVDATYNQILVKENSIESATTFTIVKDGPAVQITTPEYSFSSCKVKWQDNIINFYEQSSSSNFKNLISGFIATPFWKLIQDETKEFKGLICSDNFQDGIPIWNNQGKIVGRRTTYSSFSLPINANYASQCGISCLGTKSGTLPRIYVPTDAATAGYILKSFGQFQTPQFVDFYATYTDGIHFLRITQEDYDALTTKDPNTMYLIVEPED